MRATFVVIAAVSFSTIWQAVTRPTNSSAAASRGMSAYERQQYANATREFATAASSSPSTRNLFNLGTAQVAAGQRTEGSATLSKAMEDPSLRAKALFNRGNSALAAKAFEHAVRDYSEALKLLPADRAAKRNLEIALQQQQDMQRQQQSGGRNQKQQGPAPQPQKSPQPAPSEGEQEKGEADAEALLRSVQQQEQEELSRMKRARGETRRVGW